MLRINAVFLNSVIFSFQNKKIFTLGLLKINVHPLNSSVNTISGHTIKDTNLKIEYDDKSYSATSDENGYFEVNIGSNIIDNKRIKITSVLNGIFNERVVTTPFQGELTLLKVTENIPFDVDNITTNPIIIPKKNSTIVTIVDSRQVSTKWKLYVNYVNPMIEKSGKVLLDSLFFKKFDNDSIDLKTEKKLIFEASDNGGNVSVSNVTFSPDKGLYLKPSSSLLEDEDYSTLIIWSVEE